MLESLHRCHLIRISRAISRLTLADYLLIVPLGTLLVLAGRVIIWWLASTTVWLNQPYSGLLLILLGLGLVGMSTALVELAREFVSHRLTGRYWLNFSRRQSFPSFTGVGSLFIMAIYRLSRDRAFLLFLGLFLIIFLAKSAGWPIYSSWPGLFWLFNIIISLMMANALTSLSGEFLDQFPALPISREAVDFTSAISGLVVLATIDWVILFALLRLGLGPILLLISVALPGFLLSYAIACLFRLNNHYASSRIWRDLFQITALTVCYKLSMRLSLPNLLVLLLFGLTLLVLLTSYREDDRWVTIN